MNSKPLKIAIDGPVGSGKGTVAHILRQQINAFDIYTGGTYRAVALFCLRHNINIEDHAGVINALGQIDVGIDNEKIFLNGEDVTDEVKKNDVANATPRVAVIREVRDQMIAVQKKGVEISLDRGQSVIVEGRDIGTNVIPDADLKVFLTADLETRVNRRITQLEKFGEVIDKERVRKEVEERDRLDYERENDPLERHPEEKGYFVIDNSSQSEEQTVVVILEELKKRGLL